MMPNLKELRVKLFADGADIDVIQEMAANPMIKGFTTNPTLMRKAGVTDYVAFAKAVLKIVPDRPISFEVFSDDFTEIVFKNPFSASFAQFGDEITNQATVHHGFKRDPAVFR